MPEEQQPKRNFWYPGIAWLVMLIGTVIYEWWAIATKQPTLSAWVWKQDATYPWFKWVLLVAICYMAYHFLPEKRL